MYAGKEPAEDDDNLDDDAGTFPPSKEEEEVFGEWEPPVEPWPKQVEQIHPADGAV